MGNLRRGVCGNSFEQNQIYNALLICKFLLISFLNKVFTIHGKLINFLLEFCCVSSQSLVQ